jgi:hypothetical protein
MIREYEVTYIIKEYLMKQGWYILAYNPPGSQGTFTIPNPTKDPEYRGQTGSESPDIIALKSNEEIVEILIVECKSEYDEDDIQKMRTLFGSKDRRGVFLEIVVKQALANGYKIDPKRKIVITLAKAHGGEIRPIRDMKTFHIETINLTWNPECFSAKEDINKYFKITES